MNTKLGLCALLLPVTVAVATADNDRTDTRQLRGFLGWRWGVSHSDCGYIPPQCCCIDGHTDCRPTVCEAAAANGGHLPCGGEFYTIGDKIFCTGSGEANEIPNGGDQDDEETVSTETPDDQDDEETITSNVVGDAEGTETPDDQDAEEPVTSNVGDAEGTKKPDGSAKCTIKNWNLEGRGEGYSCTSNDDCKYGCCSTGQVKGKCISPFINPSFSDFLGCMPEFSECETNRMGEESPYVNNEGELESEYWYGIDKCNPNSNPAAAGITKCCSNASDCVGFGEECCDRVRLQCVPKLGNPVMIQRFRCLEEGV